MNQLTADVKPYCVGRYMIDMPRDALTFWSTNVNDVTIETQAMSLEDYRKAMQARSEQLHAITKSTFGYRFLYMDEVVEGIPESRLFISLGKMEAMTDADRTIEAYKWDRGYQIKMQIDASDARNSSYFKDDPETRNDPAMTDTPEKTRRLIWLLDHARGRADDDIPTEPGLCFQGGFLPGKAGDTEDVSVQFVPPQHRDVSFNFESDTSIQESTTLLDRKGDVKYALTESGGHLLRDGAVELRDLHAEEMLAEDKTILKVVGIYAYLEANSKTGGVNTPTVSLEMYTGSRNRAFDEHIDKASLTSSEAVAVWDKLSRTLRPRPNGF